MTPGRKHPVTQLEIARQLGVSRITVSKALRNHPDISAGMKEKVRKTAEKMGYTPNLVAANLSQRKTHTIGVVIPDLENSFFAYLADSIIDTATENDYRIILTVSREKGDIEAKNIRNLLGMRVDGLLVCVAQTTSDREIFGYSQMLGIPLVFFDRSPRMRGFSHISFNDSQGMEQAVKQLISSGFTRFAHFAGYKSISVGSERSTSFIKALKSRNLPIRNEWIIEGGYETDDGYSAFRKLLTSGKMPEIIITVNDRVALGAYRAAAEAGLKIPGDISIAGFGFSETTSMFNPPLAVINQDPRLLGVKAVGVLLDHIGGKLKKPLKIRVDEQYLPGRSVGTITRK